MIPGLEPKTRMRDESARRNSRGGSGKPGNRFANEHKHGFGNKPKAGGRPGQGRDNASRETGFTGPSERRMQERYNTQPAPNRTGEKRKPANRGQRPQRDGWK